MIFWTLLVAVALTIAIWALTFSSRTGSAAEDAMASTPAMFATVAVWVIALVVLFLRWLLLLILNHPLLH
jgi:hypothetical protein